MAGVVPTERRTNDLAWAHPLVRDWFLAKFGSPTEPQAEGWPAILDGHDALISAPTGSGKTLAAFLACIDRLVRQAVEGTLEARTSVLYVSPLKALGNDIQKNLDGPLAEIVKLAESRDIAMPEIRTAVRTGDTLMHARRAMLDHPPHILVTTPESLYILLTSTRGREMLKTVETVIVDEIHAVADDKRGAHLTLSLERLDALIGRRVPRIGLSATQRPITLVAEFLGGTGRPLPRLVQVSTRRAFDLAVEVPPSELGPIASNEMWDEIYDRIAQLSREHRSTLVFVNTRRLAERLSHHLAERIGADFVAAHHGSLARKIRLEAEQRLKRGDLRVLVATASLELGIDIGSVDLVCQIGSPRAIATAIQRIGRAGHWRGATPKGRIFATTRDELIECAALVLAMRRGELDRLIIPVQPLDILAQQIVAACAAEDWQEDELFALVRRAYPYRDLPRDDFDDVVEMLSEGIASKRGRYGAYLHRDRVNGRLRGRRNARLSAITSGGAIPDNALYTVVTHPEGTVIGTVDEDFAVESLAGDVMLLGNTSWRIRRVGTGRVLVEDAHGAAPTIPFWRGEAPARTIELSEHVSEVRQHISDLAPQATVNAIGELQGPLDTLGASPADGAIDWLQAECGLDRSGAEQAVTYIVAGRTVLGAVPTTTTIIAERFFDEGGGMQLIVHSPYGGRLNKAWGLALRKRFCVSFNFELQAAATDNGVNIALAEQHSFPLADVFRFLHPKTVKEVLQQATLTSPIFGARFKWDAGRALALLRFQGGRKVPVHIQRLRADDLLASVFPDAAACQENIEGDIQIPDHPLIREVMKDVLTEAMDLDGLKEVLGKLNDGSIRVVAVDTPVPSQFSHEILNANPFAYLDDAPLEARRARAVELRRVLPESVLSEVGGLDPEAIEEVQRDAWPDVRDADDLHDVMQTLVMLPDRFQGSTVPGFDGSGSREGWADHFDELAAARRSATATLGDRSYWVTAERAKVFRVLFPEATFDRDLPELPGDVPTREEALTTTVHGWLSHIGPTTVAELSETLGLPANDVDAAMLRLEATGTILRGRFRSGRETRASFYSARGAPPPLAPAPALPESLSSREPQALPEPRAPSPEPRVEWCERRLLARIHRLTLGRLRREIEPITAAQFMNWLLAWQHLAPGTQATGERGALEVVRQLQGFEAPANSWEPQLLARRIAKYNPAALDQLCLSGAVGWGRLSPHPAITEPPVDQLRLATADAAAKTPKRRVIPTSVAPITFFVREDADWLPPARPDGASAETPGLSRNAALVRHVLQRAGASFFPDLVRMTKLLKSEVEASLWELVTAGLVTADGFDNLRALIDPRRRSGQGSGRTSRPRHSTGRWSLLHTGEHDPAAAVTATCWMLLRRYGVVFRELLARESVLPKWRELLMAFRRLEDRGEIRGGRFVSGFIGEQFALPVAVESLRAARRGPASQAVVTVSAADPLNLVGILVPGERVAANSGRFVTFRDGVAEASDSGTTIVRFAPAAARP
jgi:ATP-dependent Lhr-like helicase